MKSKENDKIYRKIEEELLSGNKEFIKESNEFALRNMMCIEFIKNSLTQN